MMHNTAPAKIQAVALATVLPGAAPFKEGNVNETFRGQVLLADGSVKPAIIKDLDARQLVNELLASVLAKATKMPTPDAFLGLVKAGDLNVTHAPKMVDGNRLVFVSVDVKVPNVTVRYQQVSDPAAKSELMKRVLDWSELGRLYAFDAWIANIDRHPGNLLLGNADEFWLIDHGHSFSGPAWEPQDLKHDGEYDNRLKEWVTPQMSQAQRTRRAGEAATMGSVLCALGLADARVACMIDLLRSPAHGDAVEGFLDGRTATVEQHASRALGMLV